MKQFGIRTIAVSLAAVSAAFIGGIVISSHPAPTKPMINLYKATADVTQAAPETAGTDQAPTTTTTTNSTATPQPAPTTITTPAAPTNSPAPQMSQNSTVAPASTPAVSVTAVSADMLPWTDPVATAAQGGLPGYTTTVSYQYCQYSYSDGSTKQATARTKYATTNAGGSQAGEATLNSGVDCAVSTAPAAN